MNIRYVPVCAILAAILAATMSLAVTAPAMAADTVTATFAGTIEKKPVSITFKDVYAIRAKSSRGGERILVYLTDTPMDKGAMTATLRKHRKTSAITTFGSFLDGKSKAHITLEGGNVTNLYIFHPPGSNLNAGRSEMLERGKNEIKIAGSRLEGRFTAEGPVEPGTSGKIDVRLSVELADTGPGGPVED